MHLILYHVAELQHVNHAHSGRLVETLAGAAVVKIGLAITGDTSLVSPFVQVVHCGTVENRCRELLAQFTAGPSEHGLENLTEVHT